MAIKHAILGLLHYGDMHGYRIKNHLETNFGHMWTVNFGQIYPALKEMLGDGLVMVESALGRHRRTAMRLHFPEGHCWVGHGIHHLDLLSDPVVYRKLLGWLQT